MIWSIFRRFSHYQRFRYVGNFLHPRYAIHRIPHPREVSLRVNPVFQKNATSSPPLAILTDQACKPFTRKAPLVAPLGMLTATRRKRTRLSFFIIPFSEQEADVAGVESEREVADQRRRSGRRLAVDSLVGESQIVDLHRRLPGDA
ncbi:hypothetical protein CK203_021333 [Vitis vinifera]|uniref:Uncharacterized protein n=1 Tax=Vitis vinifera TaxID=29760 RepID=A0A438IMH7_VITVI|nr:hypothetical protein CK203_021333 [Vitis vinifera]